MLTASFRKLNCAASWERIDPGVDAQCILDGRNAVDHPLKIILAKKLMLLVREISPANNSRWA
jgi:hypothetical protein